MNTDHVSIRIPCLEDNRVHEISFANVERCVICLDEDVKYTHACEQCIGIKFCKECFIEYNKNKKECPQCRQPYLIQIEKKSCCLSKFGNFIGVVCYRWWHAWVGGYQRMDSLFDLSCRGYFARLLDIIFKTMVIMIMGMIYLAMSIGLGLLINGKDLKSEPGEVVWCGMIGFLILTMALICCCRCEECNRFTN